MKTMVEQVVEILDEGSFYLHPGRVLRSRVPLKKRRPRKIRKTLPQTTTGEKEIQDKSKEKQRKDVKDRHPNTPLKWDGRRWTTYLNKKEELEHQIKSIQEISLRTGFIGGFLMKVKQYGNKVDQGVSKLKSLSSSLNTVKDDKERDKIQSEIIKIDGDVFLSLRKMIMYVGLVSGSGGVGGDRTYKLLKKMEKRKK
jgi:hypothetical protein